MTDTPRILGATDQPLILDAADHPLILRGINRRLFLKAGAATTALLAWPFRAFPFSQSILGIRKFVVTLPGLGIAPGQTGVTPDTHNANNVIQVDGVGNYIPVLVKGPASTATLDVYNIQATEFTQRVHPDIPPTRFWGYAQSGTGATRQRYLGGVIVATSGKPVQVRINNRLPPLHILPVDPTLIDPVVAAETGMRQDRIAIHLHGGFVFWQFDGGPFTWFTNPLNTSGVGTTPTGPVHGSSFQNPGPPGDAVYNYTNDQSARLIWYHDHAYGLTRTNAYSGLASGYLIIDDNPEGEFGLIDRGTIPGKGLSALDGLVGIPLIIQDKTFWDPALGDTGYPAATPRPAVTVRGSLWYPHVYEGAADPDGLPPMTPLPIPSDLLGPPVVPKARWGASPVGPFTPISSVPEFFSDTILVNGAPYPTTAVAPRRVRYRILNGSQGRFYNLQLYVADPAAGVDGITLAETGEIDNNGNPILAPTNAPGPAFIQIGNEAGFLPKPAVFSAAANGLTNKNSNRVIGYISVEAVLALQSRADAGREVRVPAGDRLRMGVSPGDPTFGNADRFNLLLAPAERADVIIDFRGFENKKLILYNDAPAPFPGGDVRNDYYVGDHDLTNIGGAATTLKGQGPDTRILMQFEVGTSGGISELTFPQTVTALNTELAAAFDKTQPPDITPTVTLPKTLNEDNDDQGRLRQLLGVDLGGATNTYLDTPVDTATAGEVQKWQIFNTTADTHPMHFHLVNVKVRGRQTIAFNSDGTLMFPLHTTGTMRPPDPNEMGWKETVRMNPGEMTEVDMQFTLPAGATIPSPRLAAPPYNIANAQEYVWHCHILEHEEHDMMHALVVLPATRKT